MLRTLLGRSIGGYDRLGPSSSHRCRWQYSHRAAIFHAQHTITIYARGSTTQFRSVEHIGWWYVMTRHGTERFASQPAVVD
jgi:hypothetical protein